LRSERKNDGTSAVMAAPSGWKGPPVALLVAASLAAGLVLLPVLITVFQAAHVSIKDALSLLVRPIVGNLLFNTIALIFVVTTVSALVGTAVAWCVERTDLPGRKFWGAAVAVPLAIPPFITSYAWVSISNTFQDFTGAVLVVSSAYYPLVYLPVAAALRGLDPALEETARSLGEGAWGTFLRVVLPQLRPALLGGMLLVALSTLVEFGAFALLRFRTFTTALYAQYRAGLDGPESSLLAVILILLCLVCLVAELKVRGNAQYGRLGSGVRRGTARTSLGRARLPVLLGFLVLTASTLGVPLVMIGYWLLQHPHTASSPVIPTLPLLLKATFTSVGYGLSGAFAALALALPLGYLTARYRSRWVTLLERIAYLAQGVPGIVVALALISLTVQTLRPIYQSSFLLVMTYAILFLPLALVSVSAAIKQIQRGLEDAGHSLGLGWLSVTVRILLPIAGPGLGAAAAMVFISVITELTATLLLSPIGTQTLATQVWANTTSLAFAAAAPFAALMLLISLSSTWLIARRFGAATILDRT
jgi:iron(III) transport system permease protein